MSTSRNACASLAARRRAQRPHRTATLDEGAPASRLAVQPRAATGQPAARVERESARRSDEPHEALLRRARAAADTGANRARRHPSPSSSPAGGRRWRRLRGGCRRSGCRGCRGLGGCGFRRRLLPRDVFARGFEDARGALRPDAVDLAHALRVRRRELFRRLEAVLVEQLGASRRPAPESPTATPGPDALRPPPRTRCARRASSRSGATPGGRSVPSCRSPATADRRGRSPPWRARPRRG